MIKGETAARPEAGTGRRMRAVWKDATIAESADTVVVEGNHYFPLSSVRSELLRPSQTHTTCHWKGLASYYDLVVGGADNKDAVWFYPDPKPEASMVKDRVAFWHGVKVEPAPEPAA